MNLTHLMISHVLGDFCSHPFLYFFFFCVCVIYTLSALPAVCANARLSLFPSERDGSDLRFISEHLLADDEGGEWEEYEAMSVMLCVSIHFVSCWSVYYFLLQRRVIKSMCKQLME